MDPIDSFIDGKETTRTGMASTQASQIEHHWEQFVNAALKKAAPSSLFGTLDVAIDIDDAEKVGIYRGDFDIDDDGILSYHSSDGLDKDDSVGDLSLGDGMEGTSPPANARNTAGHSLLRKQNDDLPDWQHTDYLTCFPPLSPKCFPCIAFENRINVNVPSKWICVFLWKSGATSLEVFDIFLRTLALTWSGTAMTAFE